MSQQPGRPKARNRLQSLKKHHTRHRPVMETDEHKQEHDASTHGTVQLACETRQLLCQVLSPPELDPMRSCPNREQVLLAYQAKV